MKRLFVAVMCGLMCLSGCGTSKEELKEEVKQDAKASAEEAKKREEEKKNVVDEAFIESVATGFEKRSDAIDNMDSYSWGKPEFVEAINAELKEVEGFKDQEFNDPELKEEALKYIDALQAQKEAAELMTTDLGNGSLQWNKPSIERAEALYSFKNNYGLKVDDKCKKDLASLTEAVNDEDWDMGRFFNDMQIEELDDNGDIPHYRITGVNDSSDDLSDVVLQVQLEGRDGNVLGTMSSAPLMSIASGQKYTFDLYGDGSKAYPSVKDMRLLSRYYCY